METRMDLFADTEGTTSPVDSLILTRIRQPILGCGSAVLVQFQRGQEDVLVLGYCSPDELRIAMRGIDIVEPRMARAAVSAMTARLQLACERLRQPYPKEETWILSMSR